MEEHETVRAEGPLNRRDEDLIAPARVDVGMIAERECEGVAARPAVSSQDVLPRLQMEADVEASDLAKGQ